MNKYRTIPISQKDLDLISDVKKKSLANKDIFSDSIIIHFTNMLKYPEFNKFVSDEISITSQDMREIFQVFLDSDDNLSDVFAAFIKKYSINLNKTMKKRSLGE